MATRWVDKQAAHRRTTLRARVAVDALIRERLMEIGIDPALAVALKRGVRAAAELAAIPDTPDLKAADEAIVRTDYGNVDEGRRQFFAQIERMAEHYRRGAHHLDLAQASAAELLAYSVAVEMESVVLKGRISQGAAPDDIAAAAERYAVKLAERRDWQQQHVGR
jgi:hypothetical protein